MPSRKSRISTRCRTNRDLIHQLAQIVAPEIIKAGKTMDQPRQALNLVLPDAMSTQHRLANLIAVSTAIAWDLSQRATATSLPYELWQGVTVSQIEQLIAALTIPPRSTAVHDLWKRVITSDATPPSPGEATVPFSAVQSEALFRSGLLEDAHRVLAGSNSNAPPSALYDALKARAALAAKKPNAGCPIAKQLVRRMAELPKSLTGTASLMIGYCAVHDNNQAAAGLAADLAEDNGGERVDGHHRLACLFCRH